MSMLAIVPCHVALSAFLPAGLVTPATTERCVDWPDSWQAKSWFKALQCKRALLYSQQMQLTGRALAVLFGKVSDEGVLAKFSRPVQP